MVENIDFKPISMAANFTEARIASRSLAMRLLKYDKETNGFWEIKEIDFLAACLLFIGTDPSYDEEERCTEALQAILLHPVSDILEAFKKGTEDFKSASVGILFVDQIKILEDIRTIVGKKLFGGD